MRFALLGSHPDGLEMTCALIESGRHELVAYTSKLTPEQQRRLGTTAKLVHDLEDVLADPAVEAVIVAGTAANRPTQLRRALQSERHVLCVLPPDDNPDIAYEAAMIQKDTGHVLLPLATEALHPGVARLAEWTQAADSVLSPIQVIELRRSGPVSEDATELLSCFFPDWYILRTIRGEVAEVAAFAEREEWDAAAPLLLTGRFERGGLLQASFVPSGSSRWSLAVIGSRGRAELVFPIGWPGPAHLHWQDATGELREEAWDIGDPWPTMVEVFEAAMADPKKPPHRPVWQDAVRSLELDDAARRSVPRRRSSVLEYPEASEEVGFKGTMTLVGCGLLWIILLLVVVANWVPWLKWAVVPVLAGYLILQLLLWVIPRASKKPFQNLDH